VRRLVARGREQENDVPNDAKREVGSLHGRNVTKLTIEPRRTLHGVRLIRVRPLLLR
jgi:hypothetical protein